MPRAHKMVNPTVKILKKMLQSFQRVLSILWTLDDIELKVSNRNNIIML